MGNSYTRQAGSNIANGNIIDATDLNSEFDTLDAAFNSSTGHTHDGSGNGAPILKTGPGLEFVFNAGNVTPKTSSTDLDIGTASLKFNNANFKGTVSAPTFTATSGATIPSLTVGSSTAVTSVDADLSSVSANHDTLASAKAIKTYVDSQVTAQDLDITDGTTTGSIDLDSQSLTFTGSTGITASVSNQTVTISTDDSAIVHDSLSGFVSAEHVDHSGVSITAGNGLTGGGTIEATRTLTVDPHTGIAVTSDGVALSHLGLESLADPDADRVAFWDDSEGAFKWLEMGSNLAISGTTLNATDTNTTYSTATTSTLGLVKLGDDTEQTTAAETVTTTANRSYAVQLNSSDQMVVNVPWVDTNTDTTYSTATSSTLGLVKLGSDTEQSTAAESVTSTASRTYAVQLNSSDQMVVNVPWTDANDNTTYTAGTGLTLDGTTFNANVDATTQTVASETVSATASRTYAVQVDNSDNLVVNVPWSTSATSSTSYTIDAADDIILDSETNKIIFKNGTGGDSVEHTLYDSPATSGWAGVSSPSGATNHGPTYTIKSLEGIELNSGSGSGDGVLISDNSDFLSNSGNPHLTLVRKYKYPNAGDICGQIIFESNADMTVRPELAISVKSNTAYTASDTNSSGKAEFFVNSEGYGSTSASNAHLILDGAGTSTLKGINNTVLTTHESNGDIKLKAATVTIEKEDDATKYATVSVDANNIVTIDNASGYHFKTGNIANNNFIIESTHTSGTFGASEGRTTPDLTLYSNSNVSTADMLGTIEWIGKTNNSDVKFADIIIQVSSNTVGSESSVMTLNSVAAGTEYTGLAVYEGAARLYYQDSLKLQAVTGGIDITGALDVSGALSKGSGSFKIDHPLPAKTETHHLVHSFIEGPQADLIYRGRAELVDGTATVNIDTAAGMTEGTFVVLCGDVQCFTSNESGWTAVKGSVSGNTLTITAQDNTCTDTISWMVVGERKDQHMIDTDWTDSEGHVIVEPEKTV